MSQTPSTPTPHVGEPAVVPLATPLLDASNSPAVASPDFPYADYDLTPRRTSSRVRSAPQFFMADPAPLPRKKVKKKKTDSKSAKAPKGKDTKSSKAKDATTKGKSSKGAANGNAEPEKLVLSLKVKKKVPPPQFVRIDTDIPIDIIWQRLVLREFALRFDKLCRLPKRHSAAINDPLLPWNEYLYKSLIVSLMKIIANDTVPTVEHAKSFLSDIDKTPAESDRLWLFVEEIVNMAEGAADFTSELMDDDAEEAWQQELYRLRLILRLMNYAASTETIRITLQHDMEELRKIQVDTYDQIRKLKASWEEQALKLSTAQLSLPELQQERWNEKYASAHKNNQTKIQRAEQESYFLHLKYNQRTNPLGTDGLGNTYWHFQQKGKDYTEWGSWIVCEPNRKFAHPVHALRPPRPKKRKAPEPAGDSLAEGLAKKEKLEGKPAGSESDPSVKQLSSQANGAVTVDAMEVDVPGKVNGVIASPLKTENGVAAPIGAADIPNGHIQKEQTNGHAHSAVVLSSAPSVNGEPKTEAPAVPAEPIEEPAPVVSDPPRILYYVTGVTAIQGLIEWIKAQKGKLDLNLIKELETYSRRCDE